MQNTLPGFASDFYSLRIKHLDICGLFDSLTFGFSFREAEVAAVLHSIHYSWRSIRFVARPGPRIFVVDLMCIGFDRNFQAAHHLQTIYTNKKLQNIKRNRSN